MMVKTLLSVVADPASAHGFVVAVAGSGLTAGWANWKGHSAGLVVKVALVVSCSVATNLVASAVLAVVLPSFVQILW